METGSLKRNYSKTQHIENVKLNALQACCDKNSVLIYDYYSNLQAVQKIWLHFILKVHFRHSTNYK